MKRVLIVLALLLFASWAGAQEEEEGEGGRWWLFENRRYYPALIAGVREPHLSALALGSGDKIEFQISEESPRRIWDIDVGAEIPLFGWENTDMRRIGKGKKGFGLWIPIDFHVLEDFADASAPIVNTDYRFGGMVKLQYGLSDHSSVAARLHRLIVKVEVMAVDGREARIPHHPDDPEKVAGITPTLRDVGCAGMPKVEELGFLAFELVPEDRRRSREGASTACESQCTVSRSQG